MTDHIDIDTDKVEEESTMNLNSIFFLYDMYNFYIKNVCVLPFCHPFQRTLNYFFIL